MEQSHQIDFSVFEIHVGIKLVNGIGKSVQVSHELLQMPCRRTLPSLLQSANMGSKTIKTTIKLHWLPLTPF